MKGTGIVSKRGFRLAGFCIQALALLAVFAAIVSAPAPCRAAASIVIKTSSDWSVTGKDDLQQLKRLASGVGYEFDSNAATTEALTRIGIQTMRVHQCGLYKRHV